MFGFAISFTNVLMPVVLQTIFGSKDYVKILVIVTTGFTILSAPGLLVNGTLYGITDDYTLTLIVTAVISILLLLFVLLAITIGKKLDWKENS